MNEQIQKVIEGLIVTLEEKKELLDNSTSFRARAIAEVKGKIVEALRDSLWSEVRALSDWLDTYDTKDDVEAIVSDTLESVDLTINDSQEAEMLDTGEIIVTQ
jgi:uncharacterized protein YpuA (DUF1002 family)